VTRACTLVIGAVGVVNLLIGASTSEEPSSSQSNPIAR